MRAKTLMVSAIGLLLSSFLLADMSLAGRGNGTTTTEVEAEFSPCCAAPAENNEGEAEHVKQVRRGVVVLDRFEAEVKIEIPSTALGITDAATAQAADIRLILSRAGVDYAECSLVFTEIEEEGEDEIEDDEAGTTGAVVTEAVYKVDVRQRLRRGSPVLQQVHGSCDTDLVTADNQAGVPDAQAGDVATATRVVNAADRTQDLDFLQGTFGAD